MTIKNEITIGKVVDFLNELLEIDPTTINSLFSMRFPCNKKIRFHETVQVGMLNKTVPIVGMIGILNGMFGADSDGYGKIGINYKESEISGFELLYRNRDKAT